MQINEVKNNANININPCIHFFLDDADSEESQTVLKELENIDDDLAKHGIQFVRIDDDEAEQDYGIDKV